MTINTLTQDSIFRGGRAARSAYTAINSAGEGFDPTSEIDGWEFVRGAQTADDVAVYREIDEDGDVWCVLVGTDGSGSDDSRWAVRVGDVGLDLDDGDTV